MQNFLKHPVVAGAVSGLVGAMLVDYSEFRKWKNLDDAVAYDWATASWRWFQGLVGGALAALGYGAVV